VTFEAPIAGPVTSAELRDIEQSAPKTTPQAIRAALVRAAGELEEWERRAADAAKLLEEAQALRIGQMDSHSRATEIDRRVKQAMAEAVQKLRGR
jgi:hypothetical protein